MNQVQAFKIYISYTIHTHLSNPLPRMLTINASCALAARMLDSMSCLLSFFDSGGETSDLKHLVCFTIKLANMVPIRRIPTAAHPCTVPTLLISAPCAAILCGAVMLLGEFIKILVIYNLLLARPCCQAAFLQTKALPWCYAQEGTQCKD